MVVWRKSGLVVLSVFTRMSWTDLCTHEDDEYDSEKFPRSVFGEGRVFPLLFLSFTFPQLGPLQRRCSFAFDCFEEPRIQDISLSPVGAPQSS
jgi:hypothetical protein